MSKSIKHAFNLEELEIIKLNFSKGDTNKDRSLDKEEFRTVISSKNLDTTDVNQLFALFDTNGDGKISLYEFVVGLSVMTRGTIKQKLQFLFNFYDSDGDGVLTSAEIKVLINHIKKVVANIMGPEMQQQAEVEAEGIVNRVDANHDGQITLAEWVGFGSANPGLLEIFGLE